MKIRTVIKSLARGFLALFRKEFLLEWWQIKKNEPHTTAPIADFYRNFIIPGMKVIDVGANVGTYSKVFLDLGAEVIGMEPQKYCRDILEKRFNSEKRFHLVSSAAGSVISTGEIHKSASHTIASMNKKWIGEVQESKRFWGEKWTEKEVIDVTTLDKVIKENFLPDYIKIDVEGYEAEVLKGLSTAVKNISFEITLPEMESAALACVAEIRRLGHYHFAIPASNISGVSNWKNSEDMIKQLNLLNKSGENISADVFCKLVSV